MRNQSKTNWEKFLYYVWLPFSIFLNAVDLIRIADNFWPTLIHWTDFIQFWIDAIRWLRDILFIPLSWIDIKLNTFYKDYFLFGAILTNSLLIASLNTSTKNDIQKEFEALQDKPFIFRAIKYGIYFLGIMIVWPIIALVIVLLFFPIGLNNHEINLRNLVFQTLFRILIVISILIFINYLTINVIANKS